MHWGSPAIIPLQHNQMHASTSFYLCTPNTHAHLLTHTHTPSLSRMAGFNMVPDLCACNKDCISYFLEECGGLEVIRHPSAHFQILSHTWVSYYWAIELCQRRSFSAECTVCGIYMQWKLIGNLVISQNFNIPLPPRPHLQHHHHHTHLNKRHNFCMLCCLCSFCCRWNCNHARSYS